MAVAPTPVAFTGTLLLPADASLPPDQVPFNASFNINSAQPDQVLNVTGSGSLVIGFGTVAAPGAKLVAVRYDQQTGAPPILLKFNGSTIPLELTTGGFLVYASPTPASGITSLTIDHTGDGQIKVWILG